MAYTPTYTTDDVAPMIVDLGLVAVASMIGFGTLIGLVILYRWFVGKKPVIPGFK